MIMAPEPGSVYANPACGLIPAFTREAVIHRNAATEPHKATLPICSPSAFGSGDPAEAAHNDEASYISLVAIVELQGGANSSPEKSIFSGMARIWLNIRRFAPQIFAYPIN
jgi:hypothetical protein